MLLINVCYFIGASFLAYILSQKKYQICFSLNGRTNKRNTNLSVLSIFILVSIYVGYNYFITKTSTGFVGDRYNYYQDFIGLRPWESFGTQWINDSFRHLFPTADFTQFLIFISAACIFLVLQAYKRDNQALPVVLLMLFSSQFIFSFFINLKQCWAIAFAALLFSILLSENERKRHISCGMLIILACLCHVSSFILIPVYLLCCMQKRKNLGFYVIVIAIVAIFCDAILLLVARFASPILPGVVNKILVYFGRDSQQNEGQIVSLIKGIPIYCIVIEAWINRCKYQECIHNFNNYFLLAVCSATTYALSVFQTGWFSRLLYFFLFPTYVLLGQILINTENRKKRQLLFGVTWAGTLSFTIRYLVLIYTRYGGF